MVEDIGRSFFSGEGFYLIKGLIDFDVYFVRMCVVGLTRQP